MDQQVKHFYEFGPFRLDISERLLLRNGHHVPLTPKAFEVLLVLVENGGHVIDKDKLIEKVWPDTYVEEVNLAKNVYSLRKVLSDEQSEQYIETIPRRGYRFVAGVKEIWENQTGSLVDESTTSPPTNLANLANLANLENEPVNGKNESVEVAEGILGHKPAFAPSKKLSHLDILSHAADSIGPPHRNRLILPLAFLILGIAVGSAAWFIVSQRSNMTPVPPPKIVPITSYLGFEDQAGFSPDGNHVAFVWNGEKEDNNDIYVKLIGAETPLRLTTNPASDINPTWSPDGRYIAFLRQSADTGGIFLIPALGGPERKLAEAFPYRPVVIGNALNYSPDGKFLVVPDKRLQEEPFSIYSLSIETGEKVKLTSPPAGYVGDYYPSYSPDRKLLAFVRSQNIAAADIFLLPADEAPGSEPRRLTFDNCQIRGLSWTSNGSEIVFSSMRGGSIHNIWKISAAGGVPERLTFSERDVFSPAISPQGNRLAYTQSLSDINIWRLGLNDLTSQSEQPVRLVSSTRDEHSPNYSPDGQKVVFASRRSGSYEIWVCGSDGSNPRQLTNMGGPLTGTPRWSPDGRQIVFDSWFEGNADIYVISVDGGMIRRLTTDPAEDITPSWSRDGRSIYFGSTRSGSIQIWKVPVAGGPAVQVTNQGGFEGQESTDGKYFYYAKGRAVPGIWRVPVMGGEESLVLNHHQAGLWRYWAVTDQGIYFATAENPPHPVIEFFSFDTKKIKQVATIDKPLMRTTPGLTVSPDGRWLLIAKMDQTGYDIMLVENFQ